LTVVVVDLRRRALSLANGCQTGQGPRLVNLRRDVLPCHISCL